MTEKKVKKGKKVTQYYKVINVKNGHHGYHYKLGLNVDPLAKGRIEDVGFCQPGAFYFVTADYLIDWTEYGSHIAWVTPVSEVASDFDKFKAFRINVTKILPFEKALPLIKEIPLSEWEDFGVEITAKQVVDSDMSLMEKFEWLFDKDEYDKAFKLIIDNKTDRKFMRELIAEQLDWTVDEAKKLIKEDLMDLITTLPTIRELIERGHYKEAMIIISSNPKKWLNELL